MHIGQFEILSTLGAGARGTVYRARNIPLGREIALKQLHGSVVSDSPPADRFRQETARLLTVDSPRCARVYSADVLEGRPVIELELLGDGLHHILARGPLDLETALTLLRDVLEGLRALHAAGMVHANLKPTNVLKHTDGRWKVTDGGVSIIETESTPTLQASTILYVPPETLAAQPRRDARSDLYSAGILAYEAVLGPQGFGAGFPGVGPVAANPARWLQWLEDRSIDARPLHALRPDVPVPVSHFFARLMLKDPELRYASADAALTAIGALVNQPMPLRASAENQEVGPNPVVGRRLDASGAIPASEAASDSLSSPRITVRRGGQVERETRLGQRPCRIGRDPMNDIVLADPGKAVSRTHAEVRWANGQYIIVDLDSQNGLWVGGRKHSQVTLAPGVPVLIGPYELIYDDGASFDPERTRFMPPPEGSAPRPGVIRDPASSPVDVSPPRRRSRRTTLIYSAVAGLWVVVIAAVAISRLPKSSPPIPPQETATASPASTTSVPAEPPTPAATEMPPEQMHVGNTRSNAPATARPGDKNPDNRPSPRNPARPPASAIGSLIPPAPAPRPSIARRPNESEAAWTERERQLLQRLELARSAMSDARWPEALSLLTGIQIEEPGFRDVGERLAITRGQISRLAREAVDEGIRAEERGDLVEAMRQYRRALNLEDTHPAALDAARKLRIRMNAEAKKAYQEGQLHEAYRRSAEAIVWYQRALDLLADDDPLRVVVRESLQRIRR